MLDQAFDALNTYNWGADPAVLNPINEAIVATHGNSAARTELEGRLIAALKSNVSRDAKDFICRRLMVIGTAASVPMLAELLPDKDLSHMARYALERIPVSEAAQALRSALPKLSGSLKLGVIGSLGSRGDSDCVPALAALLGDADTALARAAAYALGAIRNSQASRALAAAKLKDAAATDASLACAEGLLANGGKAEALAIYKGLANEGQPKHVRLAATRGVLACVGKKE